MPASLGLCWLLLLKWLCFCSLQASASTSQDNANTLYSLVQTPCKVSLLHGLHAYAGVCLQTVCCVSAWAYF